MFVKFGTIILFQLNRRKDGFTYAHITFETVKQAHAAINEMNKKKIEDKTLKVSFSAPNCVPKWKRFKQESKPASNSNLSEDFLKIRNKKTKK
jgi:RNA recognition motif-containing protein